MNGNKAYKWFLIAMLSFAFFFHQADRALFGLLTIPIQDELNRTGGQMGWINGALFATLAVMTPIAGFCGDRFSRKWLITGSLIFWSITTACMGFVGDFHVLGLVIPAFLSVMFFRSIATGGGESFYAPSAYALIAVHHKETRSVALSIHQAALYIGLMTSGALVGWILHALKGSAWVAKHFGELGFWRPVFIIFGSLGFLLGVGFIFFLREKGDDGDKGDGGDKRVDCKAKGEKPPLIEGLKAFFCNPSALLASGGFIAIVIANNVYMSWAPKFVAEKFAAELGDKTAAVASAGNGTMLWHHVFAFAAIMAGGFLTDAFVKQFPRFRLLVQGMALFLGAPMLVWFGLAPNLISTWVAVAAYGVFRGLFEVNTHASLFDVVAPKYRSTAVGLMTMLAFFLGALAPVLMGYLYDAWGLRGFEVGFAIIGGVYAVGGALMLVSFFFTFNRDRVTE
ncbi:MAG: MFS transporter [Kiritimatiellae bacterium]|nr:MFS transporter [Kiritimatiellia bacterium]